MKIKYTAFEGATPLANAKTITALIHKVAEDSAFVTKVVRTTTSEGCAPLEEEI